MSRVPGGHNDKLDLFKCIGIYGVVLAHVPLPGQFGMAVCALAKFSVVLFFLTAGYFSYDRSSAVLRRRTLKTGWLLLGAAALLVVLGYAMESRQGVTVWGFFRSRMTLPYLKEMLYYQIFPLPYSWPLWYLGSQLIVYGIWWAMTAAAERLGKKLPYDLLMAAAVVLVAYHMYHVEWQVLTGGTAWESKLVRNAWLDGFPFFAMGAWFGRHQERIRSLPVRPLWVGAALCVCLALAEFFRVGVIDVLLGTTLLALVLMAISLASPRVESPLLRATACFCGKHLTFYIYVLHVPLYAVVREWREQVALFDWLMGQDWLRPLAIAAASTLIALGLYSLSALRRSLGRKGD